MTQRWRTVVLLYPVLDARYGSGLQRSRVQRVMTREERGVVMDVVERLPATVEAWSDGLATLEPFDVVEVRRPIRSLSSSGGGRWWVGPREVRPELEVDRGDRHELRLRLRPVAVRAERSAVRLGLHDRAVRGDVPCGLLVDLDRPLADAPDRSRPRAGLRPRVAAPGRGCLSRARGLGGPTCRHCTMPRHSRRRGRWTRRHSGRPSPSTTTAAHAPGRRGTATG